MIGERLSHYHVLAPLGAGGMGEVYRARDESLERDVAFKVLPESLTADEVARSRLMREARAAAALSHPHICAVYEVGEACGRVFIAMELVEGRPLSERIGGKPLPIESVIRYGGQIAEALSHAHERHLIHRDLKSQNVVITPDGRAKVLDFGLAKRAWEQEGGSTPRETTLTQAGTVVGTPHYIAPEVLRGSSADARSDLWALGCVLYEMATGALPFQGASEYELAAAILNDMPAPLPARVPAGLRAVIGRCLAKQPGERYQRADEVRAALETLQSGEPLAIAPARRTWRPGRALRSAAALAIAACVVAAGWIAWSRFAPKPATQIQQLTTNAAEIPVMASAISPGGTKVVYVDTLGIYLRDLVSGEIRSLPLPLAHVASWISVEWFPDESRFALVVGPESRDNTYPVWIVSLRGWAPQPVARGKEVAVSPDGTRLAVARWDQAERVDGLWVMRSDGTSARRILRTGPEEDIRGLTWSPDGRRIAYVRVGALAPGPRIESIDAQGGKPAVLFADAALEAYGSGTGILRWMPKGRLLFVREDRAETHTSSISIARVNAAGDRLTGPPRVIERIDYSMLGDIRVSRDGKRATLNVVRSQQDVFVGRLDPSGTRIEDLRRLTFDEREDVPTGWTPDGAAVLFSSARNGRMSIYRQSPEERRAVPLMSGPVQTDGAQAGPDGKSILYWQWSAAPNAPGVYQIMSLPLNGGPPQAVLEASGMTVGFRCSPAGVCVVDEIRDGHDQFTTFQPGVGRGRAFVSVAVDTSRRHPSDLSPDGRTIALAMNTGEADGRIRLIRVPEGTWSEIRLVGQSYLLSLDWAASGRELLILEERAGLSRVSLDGKISPIACALNLAPGIVPSPDGRHLALCATLEQANVWLMEKF